MITCELEKMKRELDLAELMFFDPFTLCNDKFYGIFINLSVRTKEKDLFIFLNKYLKNIKIDFEKTEDNNGNSIIIFRIIIIDLALNLYILIAEKSSIIVNILFNKNSNNIYNTEFIPMKDELVNIINEYINLYEMIYLLDNKKYNREIAFKYIKSYPGITISHDCLYMIDKHYIFSDGENIYDNKGNNITTLALSLTKGNWANGWYFNKSNDLLK